jgi:hypothetical protein
MRWVGGGFGDDSTRHDAFDDGPVEKVACINSGKFLKKQETPTEYLRRGRYYLKIQRTA